MWKEYYKILKKIPKIHFGIYIILFFGSLLATQFITNEEKNINYERLYFGLIVFSILIPLWVQVQWTRFALKELLRKSDKIIEKSNTVSSSPLRHLTYSINLVPYKIERILISLSVTRRWYPDAGIPSASDFIRDLSIDDFLCYKCNNNYISRPDKMRNNIYVYCCSNEKCTNKEFYREHEYDTLLKKGKLEIKGDIRNNMEKYWGMYTMEYLKLTKNHPELYDRPSTSYVSSYI
jgi:hypothetical protein